MGYPQKRCALSVSALRSILRVELLVEKASLEETPRTAIVEVEVSFVAEVFARKELAVCARNQSAKLLVGQLIELLRRDRLSDS